MKCSKEKFLRILLYGTRKGTELTDLRDDHPPPQGNRARRRKLTSHNLHGNTFLQ